MQLGLRQGVRQRKPRVGCWGSREGNGVEVEDKGGRGGGFEAGGGLDQARSCVP